MPVVSSRVLGWAALALAIAATIIVVPPLIIEGARRGEPAVSPQPAESRPAQPSTAPTPGPTPWRTPQPPVTTSARPPAIKPAASASRLRPITVHAADPANLRSGARVIDCPSCVDGSRVGYIGGPNTLAVRITGVPKAGERTLTIVYETEQPRTLQLAVDDGAVRTLTLAGARSWLIPARVSVRLWLPAGACWIRFFNDAGSAPDINTVTVS